MSGPITVGFLIAPGIVALAEHAIREARAMKREYGDVLEQLRARESELEGARRGQQAARLERISAIRREVARQTARFNRLQTLAGDIGASVPSMPAAPHADEDAAWEAHAAALEAASQELEALIARAGSADAARRLAALKTASAAPTLEDVLGAYVLERRGKAGLDPAQAEHFRQTAARVLGRLEASDEPIPAELEALARDIVLSPSVERAVALASELRLAVQRLRDARTAQHRDTGEARRLLAELPEEAPAALARALERVAAGVEPMDAALRKSVHDVLDTAAADRVQREHEAAAYVLEQSLRDLGYEVDDIEATLFAHGGTVHFRRAGWDNYFVRMRVNAGERTANFNVVRAKGDEETEERRRLDALAEDRWCAEFPRLMETLAARGITLDVRRRLGAGEVPVQVVDPTQLPRVHADESGVRARGPLKERPLR